MTADAPRYPSTADLAAFRRTFGNLSAFDLMEPPERGTVASPVGAAAWPHERSHGIGVHLGSRRVQPSDAAARWDYFGSIARREASADRSQAFHRIAWEAAGDAGLALDMLAAIAVFEPR